VRLGDAEREELFQRLSRHAAAGRLSLEELERRVAVVAEADTHEQAASALADLPPLAGPGRGPVPSRRRFGRAAHGEADAPEPGWQPTAECFRDPRTGRVLRVWVDAAGRRHYVPDDG
jgi:hypothetical protein